MGHRSTIEKMGLSEERPYKACRCRSFVGGQDRKRSGLKSTGSGVVPYWTVELACLIIMVKAPPA